MNLFFYPIDYTQAVLPGIHASFHGDPSAQLWTAQVQQNQNPSVVNQVQNENVKLEQNLNYVHHAYDQGHLAYPTDQQYATAGIIEANNPWMMQPQQHQQQPQHQIPVTSAGMPITAEGIPIMQAETSVNPIKTIGMPLQCVK